MKHITPLDPDSPAGIAAAERMTEVFARLEVAIWLRAEAARAAEIAPAAPVQVRARAA